MLAWEYVTAESMEGRAPGGLEKDTTPRLITIPLGNKYIGTGLIKKAVTVTKSKKTVEKIGKRTGNYKHSNSTLNS